MRGINNNFTPEYSVFISTHTQFWEIFWTLPMMGLQGRILFIFIYHKSWTSFDLIYQIRANLNISKICLKNIENQAWSKYPAELIKCIVFAFYCCEELLKTSPQCEQQQQGYWEIAKQKSGSVAYDCCKITFFMKRHPAVFFSKGLQQIGFLRFYFRWVVNFLYNDTSNVMEDATRCF